VNVTIAVAWFAPTCCGENPTWTFIETPGSSLEAAVVPPSWKTDRIGDGETETLTLVAEVSPLLVTVNGFDVAAECVHCVGNDTEAGMTVMSTLA
jgi:hypothetical protein